MQHTRVRWEAMKQELKKDMQKPGYVSLNSHPQQRLKWVELKIRNGFLEESMYFESQLPKGEIGRFFYLYAEVKREELKGSD